MWNPATREMSIISKDYFYDPYVVMDMDMDIFVGFGFSSIVNDYKVVKIFSIRHFDAVTKVEV